MLYEVKAFNKKEREKINICVSEYLF